MLKTIVRSSPLVVSFLLAIQLTLSKPQFDHVTRLVDALLVSPRRKTLSDLYRQYVQELDPKAAADLFRESPWRLEDVRGARRKFMLETMLAFAQQYGYEPVIEVSLDDSLGEKDKATRHLEAVDFHHNHTESTRHKQVYTNGFVYVIVHVRIGPFEFTFDMRLYLREKSVRHLNRQRRQAGRPCLVYRSKYKLAREMLLDLKELLPAGYQVYVLFDAWYAAADLIRFCRRQGWHVVCAIRANRGLDGRAVRDHAQALRHTRYERVTLGAADGGTRTYCVRVVRGHLKAVPGEVCVIISKRHPGDKRPKYFVCTDLSLSAQQAPARYQKRWAVEVDNLYLKEALGVGDFRLQSVEATEKWFEVVLLAMNHLQAQQAQAYSRPGPTPSLADLLRQHRHEHAQAVLRAFAQTVLDTGDVDRALQQFAAPEGRALR